MKRLLTLALTIALVLPASAFSLIDTGAPTKRIQTGIRIGLTSSNLTNNYDTAFPDMMWKNQHWGNGFLLGGVADINIIGCFTIQPGAFFYHRSNTFNYLINDEEHLSAFDGKQYSNVFQVPILLSFRLGVAEIVQLQLDFGPYFAWGFGGKVKYNEYEQTADGVVKNAFSADYLGDNGIVKRYDVGIKTGVGVLAMGKIYVGAHFSYGARNTLQSVLGTPTRGHSKVWQFTLGYNF